MHPVSEKLLKFYNNDPARWTQGEWARDKNGKRTSWESNLARCFCLDGALERLVIDLTITSKESTDFWQAFRVAHGTNPVNFNDSLAKTFEDVKKAIENVPAN